MMLCYYAGNLSIEQHRKLNCRRIGKAQYFRASFFVHFKVTDLTCEEARLTHGNSSARLNSFGECGRAWYFNCCCKIRISHMTDEKSIINRRNRRQIHLKSPWFASDLRQFAKRSGRKVIWGAVLSRDASRERFTAKTSDGVTNCGDNVKLIFTEHWQSWVWTCRSSWYCVCLCGHSTLLNWHYPAYSRTGNSVMLLRLKTRFLLWWIKLLCLILVCDESFDVTLAQTATELVFSGPSNTVVFQTSSASSSFTTVYGNLSATSGVLTGEFNINNFTIDTGGLNERGGLIIGVTSANNPFESFFRYPMPGFGYFMVRCYHK